VLVGLGVLALLLLEPQVEGANATATFVEIYFRDPFVLFVYVGSIPFFLALFLGLIPTLGLLTLGASAALFERLLQRAVDLQTDNDLTV
jgi:hypothetical protein